MKFDTLCTRAQIIEHDATLRRFYGARSAELASELVAGAITELEYERAVAGLVEFVGIDTISMWSEFGQVAGAT